MSPTRQILIEVKADGNFEATIERMVEQTHKFTSPPSDAELLDYQIESARKRMTQATDKFNRRAIKTARKVAKRKRRKTKQAKGKY